MIKVVQNKSDKKQWVLKFPDIDGSENVDLNLTSSSLTNKFAIVKHFLEEISYLVPEFEDWYHSLINEYVDTEYNSEIILEKSPEIVSMAEKYIELKNIDFNNFVDLSKTSRTSIVFYPDNIYSIALASTCLKIYSIFYYDKDMKIPENIHRKIYRHFVEKCIETKTTDKIFDLIRSRTYRSSITDRYMWELIKITVFETPESYSMTVFNFLMINLLSTLSIEANPVYYLIGVVDDALRWMMCGIYKEKIVYGEAFSGVDDIYGASLTKESFHLYACNDVIARASKIGMDLLEEEYGINDYIQDKLRIEDHLKKNPNDTNQIAKLDELRLVIDEKQNSFENARDRLDKIIYLDPVMRFLTLPIASKVLEVPYKFLLTTPPKHIALIGIFLHRIVKEVFGDRFEILMDFLISCPKDSGVMASKSSYQIRNVEYIINGDKPIFGFKSKALKYEIISPICGLLCASKRNLVSVVSGDKISKITYHELEDDAISFFTDFYSNNLEKYFDEMRKKVDNYF